MKQRHKNTLEDEAFNVVQSISKAKKLYKRLIVKAHPDRHPMNIELATELTQHIDSNRFNYRELLDIECRVEQELNTPLTE